MRNKASEVEAPNFEVLRADYRHIDSLAQLFDEYRVFYGQPSNLAAARGFIRQRMVNDESIVFLAADNTERPSAIGFTQLYPTFSPLSLKKLWILSDLFVKPDARRRGAARALMSRARQLAEETGASGIILETAVDNHPAQTLYEQLGYKRDNRFYRYSLKI